MAEVYMERNNTTPSESGNAAAVTAVALIVLVLLAVLFAIYVLPAFRSAPAATTPSGGTTIQVQTPGVPGATGGTTGGGSQGGTTQTY